MSSPGAKELPTYVEAVWEGRRRRPRADDCWWSGPNCTVGYGQADGIIGAVFTAGRDFRSYEHFNGNNLPYDVKQVPAPLALPDQFLVAKGIPARVLCVQYDYNYYSGPGEWKYHTTEGQFSAADVEPHPRPDHGGPILTTREAAQLKILERGDERLEKIQDALSQTLLLQQQTAVAEKARLARIEKEDAEARAREKPGAALRGGRRQIGRAQV